MALIYSISNRPFILPARHYTHNAMPQKSQSNRSLCRPSWLAPHPLPLVAAFQSVGRIRRVYPYGHSVSAFGKGKSLPIVATLPESQTWKKQSIKGSRAVPFCGGETVWPLIQESSATSFPFFSICDKRRGHFLLPQPIFSRG